MHVNGNTGLQVSALNLGQLTAQRDHDHLTQYGLCLLHVLGHDRLVCLCQSQSRLHRNTSYEALLRIAWTNFA